MGPPVIFEWTSDVASHEWLSAQSRPFLSRSWVALNEQFLRARVLGTIRPQSQSNWLVPAMTVDDRTYAYFAPRTLLAALLRRIPREDLAGFIESHVGSSAIVCAIPLAYASPMSNVPDGEVDEILSALDEVCKELGQNESAFLYLDPCDAGAIAWLKNRGYLVTLLDANGIIEVAPHWRSVDDYFLDQPNGRELRREHRRFCEAGYTVEWHKGIPGGVLEDAVRLEGALLREKGHDVSNEELRAWYAGVSLLHPEAVATCVAWHAGVAQACVVFIRDGDTMVSKAIGMNSPPRHFLYFNIAYYEPIRFAIANHVRRVDLGPSTQDAKRRRGARGRPLIGAFRFADPAVASRWPEIATALARQFSASWGAQASKSSGT